MEIPVHLSLSFECPNAPTLLSALPFEDSKNTRSLNFSGRQWDVPFPQLLGLMLLSTSTRLGVAP